MARILNLSTIGLSIGRWSYICDIDLKRGLISQYQASDCATGLISRRSVMKPEPNVCTKQCQAKQSYHFTVAVTISAAEDLDAPRKNATARNRRTKESQLDKVPEYMRKGTYSRNRALSPALLRETMAWKTCRHGLLSDFFR